MNKTLAERAAAMVPMSAEQVATLYRGYNPDTLPFGIESLFVSHEALRRQTSTECAKTLEKLERFAGVLEEQVHGDYAEILRAILRGQA